MHLYDLFCFAPYLVMAMFSEGGLTSPDIWIVIAITLTSSISLLLNPLVFRHNIRKKRSIARDLYMALSATDFISCVVLPIVLSQRILQPKEEQCIEEHNITFCRTDYDKYRRTATITEKAVGSVEWYLTFSPVSITSVLAISRWYQISYPLRILSRTGVEIFLAALCLFQAIYFHSIFLNDSQERPTLMMMSILTVWNDPPSVIGRKFYPVEHVLALSQSIPSIIASVLTIWNITHSQCELGNLEIRARRMRSTKKFTLLNAGSAAYIGALVLLSAFTPNSQERLILDRLVVCFLPILVSTYNPVIYTMLTESVISNSARVGGGN